MQETRLTIVSGRKNVARPFFRRKQLSTSVEMQQQRTKPNTMARFKFITNTFKISGLKHLIKFK